ncbi:NAD(P)-dependent oxidoreductase [Egibacter rhizosphaerae]|uniref:NAD(P)-dependent oxidoreductase n=1 Tax=Egibacter rhizosphaerae TaxID=1670831 RepID=A0A411YHJ3_9ACTN|nr:NAD(P)-dependent oxidoreductase [Egibacter rhizosphaerae]QBI20805.1 NAD(P)-dependent oxidoreductase [Egibacter rhizosphaerae]
MSEERVLVTGASGYLGRTVTRAERAAGRDVVAIDAHGEAGIEQVDLTERAAVAELLRTERFDTVVHLAAAAVGAAGLLASARTDPVMAADVNVAATAHLAHAARESGVARFVYGSSTTVYGPAEDYDDARVTEAACLRPTTVYGATKASAEHLARTVLAGSPTRFTAVRLPLVYGGERWYGGALADLMRVVEAARAGESFEVELPADEADWVHVDDAATAFGAVSAVGEPAGAYHVVGHTGSVLELAQRVADGFGAREVSVRPAEHGGTGALPLIDDSRARQGLGFAPKRSDVEAAAASLIAGD